MTPVSLLLVLLDEVDGVLDLLDLLGILVRDLHAELFLEAHDQLDQVEGVGVEVLDERGLGGDLLFVDAKLFDDELLQSVECGSVGHRQAPPPDALATLPRTPFTRRRAASPAYVRARETASWIASPLEVAAEYSTSHRALRRIVRSTRPSSLTGMAGAKIAIRASSSARLETTPSTMARAWARTSGLIPRSSARRARASGARAGRNSSSNSARSASRRACNPGPAGPGR